MLKLNAVLLNTFKTDEYTNKETGAITPSRSKLQLLIKKPTKNGSIKQELIDITVSNEVFETHKNSIGKTIEIDVGYFGQITFFGI
jgi:hypothetical protein